MSILTDIFAERKYADKQWDTKFDDKNTVNDWVSYIAMYAGQAAKISTPPEEQRAQLVKVAGLAISAIEAFDRNEGFPPRHYDK